MTFEDSDVNTEEYTEKLSVVETLIRSNSNTDCYVIVGGNFNEDFSGLRLHTTMLEDFCDHLGLNPVIRRCSDKIDYSYHF
jgi:hypothetical protein